MVRLLASAIAVSSLLSSLVSADGKASTGTGGTSCKTSSCPESQPCCSQYGQCGVGAYCLGGCDPLFSHSLDSCMPAPVCNPGDFNLNSLDRIAPNTKYLGDASSADWVSSGSPVAYPKSDPDSVLLTMAKGTVGTLLASTAYVWYGKISATMKTSRTQGVVTAFILLSDVKDEIDFEFVGTDLDTAQSNYYFQGIPNYTHSKNLTAKDTFDDYHTYEIDWTPDSLVWSVDTVPLRTLNRNTTWNSTANRYDYPQSPSRIQLSLWPAGLSSNGQGTVDWAGGLINWSAPDVVNTGYFYARVKEVAVSCYSPPPGAKKSGDKSYIYDGDSGYNNTIKTTDDGTILSSFEGTGTNPKLGGEVSASSGTAAATGTASSAPQIPGQGNSGGSGNDGNRGSQTAGSGGSKATGGSGGSGTNPSSPSGTSYHGWSQGNTDGKSEAVKGEQLHSSMLAALLAIGGLLVM